MIKKRLLSFLGAAAITAALTFAVVSLSPSNGFTSGTMQEGLCYEATGVAPDAIVASLNGNGASADLVAYWIGYDVSYLNSYMQYYTGSSINWDDTLSDGMSVSDYVKASVLSSVKQHLVLENLASKYGVTLTAEQEAAMAESDQSYIDQYGSEEAFAARMNQKAAELGMTATHFCNPTGLHDPEHISTVRDMARLTEAALQNETFRKLFTTERYTVPATNCHPQGFTMHSTLLSQLDGTELHRGRILGGKTGYTGEAGLCLASLAEVKGREYILVTAGAGGNHSTAPYHIEDAVTVYRRVSRGS